MRRPLAPLSDAAYYPITATVALAAIGVTLLWWAGRAPVERFVMDPTAFPGEPWRLVTSTLPHLSVFHLGFNVYWLWALGTALEDRFGQGRFAALVVTLAAGSQAAEYALLDGGVGLSGIVYGLCGATAVLARHDPRLADAIDDRDVRLFTGWFFFCILTTVTGVMPVANTAHAAGAGLGVLAGVALTSEPRRRPALFAALAGALALTLLGATVGRRAVNMAAPRPEMEAYLGYQALVERRDAEAVVYLERAVALDGASASAWYNLGIARARLEHGAQALAAFERAAALAPREARYVETLEEWRRRDRAPAAVTRTGAPETGAPETGAREGR